MTDTRRIVVIAGNYQQYKRFLNTHKFTPQEAQYVDREEQLLGLCNVEIIRTGEFWKNPTEGSDCLKLLERKEYGILLEVEETAKTGR